MNPEQEAILRASRERRASGQPPTVADIPTAASDVDPTIQSNIRIDPSEHDPWLPWAGKKLLSTGIGIGRNVAGTIDMGLNALGALGGDIQSLSGAEVTGPLAGNIRAPTRNLFDKYAPAVPGEGQGKGYESAADTAEIVGIPSILNVGKNLLKVPLKEGIKETVKAVPGAVTKGTIRTAADVGTDLAGGFLGGKAGGMIGDEYTGLGTLFGGMTAGGLTPTGGKALGKKILAGEQTGPTIETVDAVNKELIAAGKAPIPMSIGLGGNKGASLIEDYLSRAPLLGQPSLKARRDQYAGIEEGIKLAAEKVRGGPSTGQITPRTVGIEADVMANKADIAIGAEIDRIQGELMQDVGAASPVRTSAAEKTLRDIINAPTGVSQRRKDHAQAVLDDLRAEYPTQPAKGTVGPPAPGASYGAIKEWREDFGKEIRPGDRPLKKGVQKQAYGGITEDMRTTAKQQGVRDFDIQQAETERLYRQRDVIEPHLKAKAETAAHNALFGGTKKKNTEQLLPYDEHTSQELSEILGNAIELRYRGESAGKPIDPESFDIKKLPEWLSNDPDFQDFVTRNQIQAKDLLTNLAKVAKADIGRTGEFSKPGGSKSAGTAAAISMPSVSSLLYGGAALAGHRNPITDVAVPVGSALANYLLSKGISTDATARQLLQPTPRGGPQVLSDVFKGATISSGMATSAEEKQRRKARESEELKRMLKEGR